MPKKATATTKVKEKKTKTDKPKKTAKKVDKAKEIKKSLKIQDKILYFEGTGRRKTAVARVRISTKGEKDFIINNKKLKEYFPSVGKKKAVTEPLDLMSNAEKFSVSVKVKGGGVTAQSEAIRHGLSRALIKFNPDFRKRLKKAGFLTRDPRMRERKKFGLKRARRAPQWSKR
jgi:small subunit ribosomal protein S9